MNRPFVLFSVALAGCALAASLFTVRPAHSDVACYPYGYAAYEADGTITTMSAEGRWQRYAPGATEATSEVPTGLWLSCFWNSYSAGEVAPDGSYMAVLTDGGLMRVTPTDSQRFFDLSTFDLSIFIDAWHLSFTRDGRGLLVATADIDGTGDARYLFIESEAGSGDYPIARPIGDRCQTNAFGVAAAMSDERVAVICPQGVLILDLQTEDVHHSGVLDSLGDDNLLAIDSWSDGDGLVLYVLSIDGGRPAQEEIQVQLSHVRMELDGTTTIATIADDIAGWRQAGTVAAVSESSVAIHGNDGLELWQRDAAGVWSKEVVAPEFDGNRVEAMTGPTRLLVSGWNVSEYILGVDGLWQTRELAPIATPPTYPGNSHGCNSGGGQSGAPLALLLVGAFVVVRRWRVSHRP